VLLRTVKKLVAGARSLRFGNEGLKLDLMGELSSGSMLSPVSRESSIQSSSSHRFRQARDSGGLSSQWSSILMHLSQWWPRGSWLLGSSEVLDRRGWSFTVRSVRVRYQGLDDWCDAGSAPSRSHHN